MVENRPKICTHTYTPHAQFLQQLTLSIIFTILNLSMVVTVGLICPSIPESRIAAAAGGAADVTVAGGAADVGNVDPVRGYVCTDVMC